LTFIADEWGDCRFEAVKTTNTAIFRVGTGIAAIRLSGRMIGWEQSKINQRKEVIS
jgi:hypothetical protein